MRRTRGALTTRTVVSNTACAGFDEYCPTEPGGVSVATVVDPILAGNSGGDSFGCNLVPYKVPEWGPKKGCPRSGLAASIRTHESSSPRPVLPGLLLAADPVGDCRHHCRCIPGA